MLDHGADGDIDIVPSGIANWGRDNNYIEGLFWKNIDGFFLLPSLLVI
jgi:hypothetical protein